MIIYFIIFIVPIILALSPVTLDKYTTKYISIIFCLILVLFIGYRNGIGGDWITYIWWLEESALHPLRELLSRPKEPLFGLINWISYRIPKHLTGDLFGEYYNLPSYYWNEVIYGKWMHFYKTHYFANTIGIGYVDIFCASIFIYGIYKFCINQKNTFLCFVSFYPTIIIVGMGFTRQSVSFGILALILTFINSYSFFKKFFLVTLAFLIHFPSIILYFFVFIKNKTSFVGYFFYIILLCIIILFVSNNDDLINAILGYRHFIFSAERFEAPGAYYKITTTLIAGSIFIINYKKFLKLDNFYMWLMFSLLAFIGFFLIPTYSLMVDRYAIFLVPLQVYVFSTFANMIVSSTTRYFYILFICCYQVSYLYAWFLFANNSYFWLPYNFL